MPYPPCRAWTPPKIGQGSDTPLGCISYKGTNTNQKSTLPFYSYFRFVKCPSSHGWNKAKMRFLMLCRSINCDAKLHKIFGKVLC